MTPADIVNVLTAVAPIATTIVTAASKSEITEKKPSVTNNISITVNNNFYTNSVKEAIDIASHMQNKINDTISSGTRYML